MVVTGADKWERLNGGIENDKLHCCQYSNLSNLKRVQFSQTFSSCYYFLSHHQDFDHVWYLITGGTTKQVVIGLSMIGCTKRLLTLNLKITPLIIFYTKYCSLYVLILNVSNVNHSLSKCAPSPLKLA